MNKTLPTTAALLALGSLAADSQAALITPYDLIYDAATGELVIDTFDCPLIVYSIQGPDDTSVDDGFIQGNHTQIPGNAGFGGNPLIAFTSLDGELSDTNRDIWNLTDPVSLGAVLPAGLTPTQLNDAITAAWYVNEFGQTGQPSSFINFNLVYVPEPGTVMLIAAGAGLLTHRRRRMA